MEGALRAALDNAGIDGATLVMDIQPEVRPPTSATWNWHVDILLGEANVECFAAQDLVEVLFLDDAGYFEISRPKDKVAEYIVDAFVTANGLDTLRAMLGGASCAWQRPGVANGAEAPPAVCHSEFRV